MGISGLVTKVGQTAGKVSALTGQVAQVATVLVKPEQAQTHTTAQTTSIAPAAGALAVLETPIIGGLTVKTLLIVAVLAAVVIYIARKA